MLCITMALCGARGHDPTKVGWVVHSIELTLDFLLLAQYMAPLWNRQTVWLNLWTVDSNFCVLFIVVCDYCTFPADQLAARIVCLLLTRRYKIVRCCGGGEKCCVIIGICGRVGVIDRLLRLNVYRTRRIDCCYTSITRASVVLWFVARKYYE